MLKNVITPLQNWLLTQNRCVGCGMPLAKGSMSQKKNQTLVICKCKRVYIYDEKNKVYRRALLDEV